jgi:hypothetical protein
MKKREGKKGYRQKRSGRVLKASALAKIKDKSYWRAVEYIIPSIIKITSRFSLPAK